MSIGKINKVHLEHFYKTQLNVTCNTKEWSRAWSKTSFKIWLVNWKKMKTQCEAHESRNENKRNVYISAAWLPHELTTNVYVSNVLPPHLKLHDQSECAINY